MKRVVILVALLLTVLPERYSHLTKASDSIAEGRITLHAAGRGNPWINLRDGVDLPSVYSGATEIKAILQQGKATPLAMTSADFDEDGVPDLVCGYSSVSGGILTIRRGNVDSIYPNSPEAKKRKASGEFTDSPFLSNANTVALAQAADFLGAGDFDADGHWDVLVATRGNNALQLLPGDGRGGFATARQITVEGNVTALATGEINRADGLTDVAVGIAASDGAKLLVFEGPEGAMNSEPEKFLLAAEVKALAMGQLDDEYSMDLAVGAGTELLIIRGRDRKLSSDESARREVPPASISKHSFESPITSIAVGNFTEKERKEIAVLLSDGKVEVMNEKSGETKQEIRGRLSIPNYWIESSRLVCAKVSSLPNDDLVLVDQANHQIHILGGETQKDSSRRVATSFDLEGEPTAVLPMRLNGDALSDLVILKTGSATIAVAQTSPMATFLVTNINDAGSGSLRQAILNANASPGMDMISFSIGSGTRTITPLSFMEPITSPAIIDGTTQPGFSGTPIVELNGASAGSSSGLEIDEGGSTTVRGFVINRFAGSGIFLFTDGGNIIEGNFIGTNVTGASSLGNSANGVKTNGTSGNTVGGTVAAARNVISGNFNGVVLDCASGGPCSDANSVLGNYIGTNAAGTAALGNSLYGIAIIGADNTVGGTVAGARNVVSGNNGDGVLIESLDGNIVQGNYIGTNVTGTLDLGNSSDGVFIDEASNNTIGGASAGARNVISGNDGNGVDISGSASSNNMIRGNYIGTDITGTVDLGNSNIGVVLSNAPNNTIGAGTPAARNIISGNNSDGIRIVGNTSTGNSVRGNYIGTDVNGIADLGNSFEGVNIFASNNTIGGTAGGDRNVISGNGFHGILITQSGATGNVVQGNYIGTDVNGTADLGNTADGVSIANAPNNTIGGVVPEARNIISGNNEQGVQIAGSSATGNVVQGNYIGTDVNGTIDLGNSSYGVFVSESAFNNTIGGPTTGARNIISGNDFHGVLINTSATGNSVQGNYIGTDVSGTAALGNTFDGVAIVVAPNNTIGGTAAGSRNLISGNNRYGVGISGSTASGNVVQGNYIGTDVTGASALGNSNHGVFVAASAFNNTIGGTSAGGNVIAFNSGRGVQIDSGTGNSILGNSIHSNVSLGIDLASNGVTGNDLGDGDTGANNLQNFPVITSADSSGGSTMISGTLNSTASTSFTIELFSNSAADPSFFGEGQTFLGSTTVTTDAGGNTNFSFNATPELPAGTYISATATRNAAPLDTSEFSHCFLVGSMPPNPVTNMNNSGPGSLRQAIIDANFNPGTNTITFDFAGGAPLTTTINLLSPLPTIEESTIIDGTTAPGYSGSPIIELNGAGAGANANGLTITGGNSTVKGLVINRFSLSGIVLQTNGGNTIQGCYIGTDTSGAADLGNTTLGISVFSSNNTIGGTTATARNVISGNESSGVLLSGAGATGNIIQGNYIGTDKNGAADLGNTFHGILIFIASNNQIGGTVPGARNIISGNNQTGIFINTNASGNVIQGNYFGTDVNGTSALANSTNGVSISGAPNNIVGGDTPEARNVISGNGLNGVRLVSAGTTGNSVQGNYIGTDVSGGAGLANAGDGVSISDAPNNTIGGTAAGAGNIIAFNLASGVRVLGATATGNSLRGNSVFSNPGLGVDLNGDGVTANDAGDSDTGPNNLQNFPVLTAVTSNATSTTIQGTLNSTAGNSFTIDFYHSLAGDGGGAGRTYIGSTTVMTATSAPSGPGDVAFNVTFQVAVPLANVVTATATNTSGDTSEFSQSSVPTAIELIEFSAKSFQGTDGKDRGTRLEWRTGFEVANLGFNVYRDENGKLTRVNSELIAGSALFAGAAPLTAGRSYTWRDNLGSSTANYWLEEIDLSGHSAWHGPVSRQGAAGSSRNEESDSALSTQHLAPSKTLSEIASDDSTATSSPVQVKAGIAKITAARIEAQGDIASQAAAKISVKREGWYRITQQELAETGFDVKTDPRLLRLFVDGREMPILVHGEGDGGFDLTDRVEFYGVGLDSASSDIRTYWLIAGNQPGLRVNQAKAEGARSSSASFTYAVERRDRTIYFSALRNGERENFFGSVVHTQPVDQSLTLLHIAQASTDAIVEVALQGVTLASHKVSVEINGNPLGEINFNGQAQGAAKFSMRHSILQDGPNVVRLVAAGGPSDVSLVDSIRVTYQHLFTADDNSLKLVLPGQQQVTIDGFTSKSIRVFDVTNPNVPQEILGEVTEQQAGKGQQANYSLSFAATEAGERRLVAFTSEQRPARVWMNQPSNLRESKGADLIIIAPSVFSDSVKQLAALRRSQGLSVSVADIEDIYDEFSYGQKTPLAIKDFLSFARNNWKAPPGYALLFGDASLDPKNYLGLGDFDLVPTKLIDTAFLETASDDWLADFNQDGIADLAVGRLPARTVAEADTMIAKLITYDSSKPSNEALLVSDKNDAFNFENASSRIIPLLPNGMKASEIRRGQLADAAKVILIVALNRGPKIVNYAGHGSADSWRGDLLTSTDANGLTNGSRLSMFVMMNCLNGYFHDPGVQSLAESLLKAPRGGAIAVWASSAMTFPEVQMTVNLEFYRQAFNTGTLNVKLGDAVIRAKASTTNTDVRRTWILFGDPSMTVR